MISPKFHPDNQNYIQGKDKLITPFFYKLIWDYCSPSKSFLPYEGAFEQFRNRIGSLNCNFCNSLVKKGYAVCRYDDPIRHQKLFSNGEQQDPTEFVTHLLDVLRFDLQKSEQTIIEDLFGYTFSSTSCYSKCGHSSVTVGFDIGIMTELEELEKKSIAGYFARTGKKHIGIEQGTYCQSNETCELRRKPTSVTGTFKLPTYFPEIIMLKINRKEYDRKTNTQFKNRTFFDSNCILGRSLLAIVYHIGEDLAGHHVADVIYPGKPITRLDDRHKSIVSQTVLTENSDESYIIFLEKSDLLLQAKEEMERWSELSKQNQKIKNSILRPLAGMMSLT